MLPKYIGYNDINGALNMVINGRQYFNFLTNKLSRLLNDVSLDTRERIFFNFKIEH